MPPTHFRSGLTSFVRIEGAGSRLQTSTKICKSRQNAGVIWRLLLIAAALGAALLPLPAGSVERFYSQGIFPWLQHGLTTLSNLTGFALFDGFVGVGVGWWLWLTLRDGRRAG